MYSMYIINIIYIYHLYYENTSENEIHTWIYIYNWLIWPIKIHDVTLGYIENILEHTHYQHINFPSHLQRNGTLKTIKKYVSVQLSTSHSVKEPDGKQQKGTTPPKFNSSPLKMVVGRRLSYWEGNFSGSMLNFGRVYEWRENQPNPLKPL